MENVPDTKLGRLYHAHIAAHSLFDYGIVGTGAAGAVIARRLAAKLADASVMPTATGGNTVAADFMTGEKAAGPIQAA